MPGSKRQAFSPDTIQKVLGKNIPSTSCNFVAEAWVLHMCSSHWDGEVQVSDWSVRPLTLRQIEYAATDAAVVLKLYDAMTTCNNIDSAMLASVQQTWRAGSRVSWASRQLRAADVVMQPDCSVSASGSSQQFNTARPQRPATPFVREANGAAMSPIDTASAISGGQGSLLIDMEDGGSSRVSASSSSSTSSGSGTLVCVASAKRSGPAAAGSVKDVQFLGSICQQLLRGGCHPLCAAQRCSLHGLQPFGRAPLQAMQSGPPASRGRGVGDLRVCRGEPSRCWASMIACRRSVPTEPRRSVCAHKPRCSAARASYWCWNRYLLRALGKG
jgi:hypothetical protein